jgi:hypothetical protein
MPHDHPSVGWEKDFPPTPAPDRRRLPASGGKALGSPFQQLDPSCDQRLCAEFGPGDPGHLGGRWWIDADGSVLGVAEVSQRLIRSSAPISRYRTCRKSLLEPYLQQRVVSGVVGREAMGQQGSKLAAAALSAVVFLSSLALLRALPHDDSYHVDEGFWIGAGHYAFQTAFVQRDFS